MYERYGEDYVTVCTITAGKYLNIKPSKMIGQMCLARGENVFKLIRLVLHKTLENYETIRVFRYNATNSRQIILKIKTKDFIKCFTEEKIEVVLITSISEGGRVKKILSTLVRL